MVDFEINKIEDVDEYEVKTFKIAVDENGNEVTIVDKVENKTIQQLEKDREQIVSENTFFSNSIDANNILIAKIDAQLEEINKLNVVEMVKE